MFNRVFIGLGLMGSRIMKRLLDAGYPVAGYNRTREKASSIIQSEMQWCDSPREVAQVADITFSMVSDTAALSAVTDGDNGILAGLSPGKIYVDMSTVSLALICDGAGNHKCVISNLLLNTFRLYFPGSG